MTDEWLLSAKALKCSVFLRKEPCSVYNSQKDTDINPVTLLRSSEEPSHEMSEILCKQVLLFRQPQDHIPKHTPYQLLLSICIDRFNALRGPKSYIKLVAGNVMNFTVAIQNENSMRVKQNI